MRDDETRTLLYPSKLARRSQSAALVTTTTMTTGDNVNFLFDIIYAFGYGESVEEQKKAGSGLLMCFVGETDCVCVIREFRRFSVTMKEAL